MCPILHPVLLWARPLLLCNDTPLAVQVPGRVGLRGVMGQHWEDVMIGLLLNDYATFQPHGGEYSAIGRALQYPAVTGCTHAAAMASLCEAKQTAAQACAAAVLQAATCSSTYTCCTVCRHQGSLEVL